MKGINGYIANNNNAHAFNKSDLKVKLMNKDVVANCSSINYM